MTFLSIVSQALPILTIIGQVIIGVIVVSFLISRKNEPARKILGFFKKRALLFAFLVALLATSASLFYSEVAKYEPCKLCWYQRIFMYPQALLLFVALLKKDRKIADYILALSLMGAAIAIFHYYLQITPVRIFACSSVGYSVACSQRFVAQFGYLTIAMMSLTAFLLNILLSLAAKKKGREPVLPGGVDK